MSGYVFVCVGTNRLIVDSFGPRVGNFLSSYFQKEANITVFGTMKAPVHFQNAFKFINKLKDYSNRKIVLIDSAFGNEQRIGNTYVGLGGIEIGKAFGKSMYFPADANIKTVVANKNKVPKWNESQIESLANQVANEIVKVFLVN